MSWEHPRYGYRRIRVLLVKEGWAASRKFVQAVRRAEGLQVKRTKKRRPRQGVSTGLPTKAKGRNHVWSWDFVHDRTDNGGPLKMMTLIDEYTRQCLHIRVARQLTSSDVLSVLSEAIEEEAAPSYIRSDNGSVPRSEAATCEAIHCSSGAAVVVRQKDQDDLYRSSQSLATERSDTSTSHSENNKRFHRVVSQPLTRCTEERSDDIAKRSCSNREVLLSVAEAQVVIEQWRHNYNNEHPLSRLGFKSPQEFV